DVIESSPPVYRSPPPARWQTKLYQWFTDSERLQARAPAVHFFRSRVRTSTRLRARRSPSFSLRPLCTNRPPPRGGRPVAGSGVSLQLPRTGCGGGGGRRGFRGPTSPLPAARDRRA